MRDKVQLLYSIFRTISIPKSWLDLVTVCRSSLKISFLLIQITFIPIILLIGISYLSNLIIESPFGYICIGLMYLYFIGIIHLCIWVILPSVVVLLINRLLKN